MLLLIKELRENAFIFISPHASAVVSNPPILATRKRPSNGNRKSIEQYINFPCVVESIIRGDWGRSASRARNKGRLGGNPARSSVRTAAENSSGKPNWKSRWDSPRTNFRIEIPQFFRVVRHARDTIRIVFVNPVNAEQSRIHPP